MSEEREKVLWAILRDVETWRWGPHPDVEEVYQRIHSGLTGLIAKRRVTAGAPDDA
jgi:uncharacterized membrane-anchored protein